MKELQFNEERKRVVKPLKTFGQYDNRGWDIPTRYAVDAEDQCWMDNAHGFPLEPTEAAVLLADMEAEGAEMLANIVRTALGLKEEEPQWMRQARAAGWTPPKS